MRPIRQALRLTALGAAALLMLGAAPAPRGNWLTTVSVSPSGSHLLGNPAAPVKVVEYISYTCPHCAHFQQESDVPMRLGYVQPGKVQVEIRHLVRDPVDMTVAVLTNCGSPARFYLNHSIFLRNQSTWAQRLGSATPAQQARWSTGDNVARMRAIAGDLGFYGLMAQRGYDKPTVDRCLGDTAMARRLAAQTAAARELGVEGTPSFLLNGVLLAGTHDWASLKSQVDARF